MQILETIDQVKQLIPKVGELVRQVIDYSFFVSRVDKDRSSLAESVQ